MVKIEGRKEIKTILEYHYDYEDYIGNLELHNLLHLLKCDGKIAYDKESRRYTLTSEYTRVEKLYE